MAAGVLVEASFLDNTARRGLRAVRPTRPAGPGFHLAEPPADGPTRDDHLDFAPWHTPQGQYLRIRARQGTRRTEADIVVPVRRHVPVTVGTADVRRLIVERTATQHTATRSSPSENGWYRTDGTAVDRCWPAGHGHSNSSAAEKWPQTTRATGRNPAASAAPGDGTA